MLFKESLNSEAGEIKQYLSVNVSVNYTTIKPHIASCERDYIKKLLGTDMYEDLVDYYDSGSGETHMDELIPLVQRALIHLSQMLEIIATGGQMQPTYEKKDSVEASGALVDRAV